MKNWSWRATLPPETPAWHRPREPDTLITLRVISHHGTPDDGRLTANFDELGGTIGRADTNQLVLPDPDRTISRVHAQVVYRDGTYAIVDRGSNPIVVNGQRVGNGLEWPIKEGDHVQIGGFLLGVDQRPTSVPKDGGLVSFDDPLADLLGPAAGTHSTAGNRSAGLTDLLAGTGLAEPLRPGIPPSAPYQMPAPTSSGAWGASARIPDDWDPFAPTPVVSQAVQRLAPDPAPHASLIPGPPLDEISDDSLNALLRLNAEKIPDARQPCLALPEVTGEVSSTPTPDVEPIPILAPPSAVFSWDAPEGNGHAVIRPGSRTPAMFAPSSASVIGDEHPIQTAPSTELDLPILMCMPDLSPAPVTAIPAPAVAPVPVVAPAPVIALPPVGTLPPGADVAELLVALREGLNLPNLKLDALTPELMRLIGSLLHESARGTVDLLVARAALKREVRAEATMIMVRENNPLKFSPSAEAALQHLLSPSVRGFMAPGPAMRDAYDDLRAHQFGFIAGMRAALDGVLQRFKPAELEGRLTQRSGLRSLLPGSRKAAMWDVFIEHYAQIGREAEDDFHTLFGKAFLQAYEEHIAQLKKDPSS